MRYLERMPLDEMDYERIVGKTDEVFNTCNLRDIEPITLLTQAGYLTIKDYNPLSGYTLGVPNEEVRRDLNTLLIHSLRRADTSTLVSTIRTALGSGDFPRFLGALKAFYAGFTYGSREATVHEANYQCLLSVLLSASGLEVVPEAAQAGGRADVVAKALGVSGMRDGCDGAAVCGERRRRSWWRGRRGCCGGADRNRVVTLMVWFTVRGCFVAC